MKYSTLLHTVGGRLTARTDGKGASRSGFSAQPSHRIPSFPHRTMAWCAGILAGGCNEKPAATNVDAGIGEIGMDAIGYVLREVRCAHYELSRRRCWL